MIAISTLLILWSGATLSEPDTIRAMLPDSEFRDMGLQKLSETELQKLYRWIYGREGVDSGVCSTDHNPKQHRDLDSDEISSQILNTFSQENSDAAIEAIIAQAIETAKTEIRSEYEAVESQTAFTAQVTNGFTGWDTKTVFVLDNGQVWRQRHGRPYKHNGNNTVRLEPSLLGMWRMTVISSGRSVAVKRID